MLIRFSKQVANTFAKIKNGYQKRIQNSVKHLRWSSLQKLSKTKSLLLFLQKFPSSMFDKVLNMLLNWLSRLIMLQYQINLNIKGNR